MGCRVALRPGRSCAAPLGPSRCPQRWRCGTQRSSSKRSTVPRAAGAKNAGRGCCGWRLYMPVVLRSLCTWLVRPGTAPPRVSGAGTARFRAPLRKVERECVLPQVPHKVAHRPDIGEGLGLRFWVEHRVMTTALLQAAGARPAHGAGPLQREVVVLLRERSRAREAMCGGGLRVGPQGVSCLRGERGAVRRSLCEEHRSLAPNTKPTVKRCVCVCVIVCSRVWPRNGFRVARRARRKA